jgi:beta-N-acetylhexosaminidase
VALGAGAGDEDGTKARNAPPPGGLALRERVGLVLISSFDEPRVPAYMRRRLRAGETAGAILFTKNAPTPSALRRVTRDLQAAGRGGALVATDQEGGAIRNVRFAGPPQAQPAQGGVGQVERAARDAARRLRSLGVNVNLAPVADVAGPGSVMGLRAFPGGPEEVASRVRASVRGHRAGGVAATPKHFPGFGPARLNTDDAPVTILGSRSALDRGLVPFRAAVEERAPLVMAAHALYRAVDRRAIASQSAPIMSGLLRRRLRFRGAAVTDSIEAEAVLRRSSVAAAAERSLLAGCDLILMTGSGSWKEVFPYLLRRARRSRRLRGRIDESARRVLELKRRLRLRAAP